MLAIAATISRNCGELGLYSSLYASLKEKRRGRAKNQLSVIVCFDFSLRNENTHIYGDYQERGRVAEGIAERHYRRLCNFKFYLFFLKENVLFAMLESMFRNTQPFDS